MNDPSPSCVDNIRRQEKERERESRLERVEELE